MFYRNLKNISRTLSFRLTISFSLFMGLSLSILIYFLYWSSIVLLVKETDATLDAEIKSLASQYNERGIQRLVVVIGAKVRRSKDKDMLYLLQTSAGKNIVGNVTQWPNVSFPNGEKFEFSIDINNEQIKARAQTFQLERGLNLLVGRNIKKINELRMIFLSAAIFSLVLVVIFALGNGLYISRRAAARVTEFTNVTSRIVEGNLNERVSVSRNNDEFDVLARHLNEMLARLEKLVSGVKHVSDNIAHDLRTPLTRLRNRIESLTNQASQEIKPELRVCVKEADDLLKVFSSLLRISRIESGSYAGSIERLDLNGIIHDAVDLYQATAENKLVTIVVELDEKMSLLGDKNLWFQMVANLLDNAIKYSPAHSSIAVYGETLGDKINFSIADRGSGVAVSDHDKMVERFTRLDPSRSYPGSGLGLSLVKVVVEFHKGTLRFFDNQPGLKVVVDFPVSQLT